MIEYVEWLILDTGETYLLYSDLCFIPDKYHYDNINVGKTTRSVCSRLCSQAFSLNCSGFLYDRTYHACTLTPFTGEIVEGKEEVATLRQGCDNSKLEFYRRVRHLGTCRNCYRFLH